MPSRRSQGRLIKTPVIAARREAIRRHHLVYVLVVNRPLKYKKGRSKIVYIGTTKNGIDRIAVSVAYRAKSILRKWGVKRVAAYLLTCRSKPGTKIWCKLERAALMTFKDRYGRVPCLNSQGNGYRSRKVFRYFSEKTLLNKLRTIEKMRVRLKGG